MLPNHAPLIGCRTDGALNLCIPEGIDLGWAVHAEDGSDCLLMLCAET